MKLLVPFLLVFSCMGQEIKPEHYLLWEISGNGLKSNSYLFGSLHSNSKRVFELSDSTYYALHHAESIALETDVFSLFGERDVRLNRADLQYDKDGQPYSSSNTSGRTVYGDEDGMPQFLDAWFQQYAHNAGKEFHMLETPDFQLNLFSTLELPDIKYLQIGNLLTSQDQLVDIYVKGNIYSLHDLIKGYMKHIPGWYDQLIVERNSNMAEKLDSLMHLKSVFCAVGAGHLAGSRGIINNLRVRGYTVRSMVASFSEKPIREERDVRSMRTYPYVNDSIRFHADFPGKPAEVFEMNEGLKIKLIYQDLGQGNSYVVEVYERDKNLTDDELAVTYIASPNQSPIKREVKGNNQVYYEGIADAYPEGVYWSRLLLKDDYILLLKAYGGNKFMNSKRAVKFFDGVSFDE